MATEKYVTPDWKVFHLNIPENNNFAKMHLNQTSGKIRLSLPKPIYLDTISSGIMDTFCDLKIVSSEGFVVLAHRSVVGSSSPFIRQMFDDQMPGEMSTLVIPDVEMYWIQRLLEIAYNGQTKVLKKQLEEFRVVLSFLGFVRVKNLLSGPDTRDEVIAQIILKDDKELAAQKVLFAQNACKRKKASSKGNEEEDSKVTRVEKYGSATQSTQKVANSGQSQPKSGNSQNSNPHGSKIPSGPNVKRMESHGLSENQQKKCTSATKAHREKETLVEISDSDDDATASDDSTFANWKAAATAAPGTMPNFVKAKSNDERSMLASQRRFNKVSADEDWDSDKGPPNRNNDVAKQTKPGTSILYTQPGPLSAKRRFHRQQAIQHPMNRSSMTPDQITVHTDSDPEVIEIEVGGVENANPPQQRATSSSSNMTIKEMLDRIPSDPSGARPKDSHILANPVTNEINYNDPRVRRRLNFSDPPISNSSGYFDAARTRISSSRGEGNNGRNRESSDSEGESGENKKRKVENPFLRNTVTASEIFQQGRMSQGLSGRGLNDSREGTPDY